jgi:F-type H+-transporting ATPase subunit b
MLSSLFILAQTTEHAVESTGEAHGGGIGDIVTKIAGDFGITLPNILGQIVSFAVVAIVLYQFAFKPVLATMTERTRKIEAGLKFADDMKSQLAAAQQESAALVKNAQLEANKIIEQARKTGKEVAEKAQKEATEQANGIIAKAQQAIDLEHKKMLGEARTEIARLVVTTTERVLAKNLSETDRSTFNDAATRELTAA